MRKVLIVTPCLGTKGGVETVTNILSSLLTQNKYEVDFLTPDERMGISPWLKLQVLIWGQPAITKELYKTIVQSSYAVVICNGEYGFGIKHKNAISYFHGSYLGLRNFTFAKSNIKSFLVLTFRAFQQRLASQGKTVVSVSEFLNAILEKQKINVNYTISNPVDLALFSPMNLEKRDGLLFVGRYDYYAKGFDLLENLAKKGHHITCVTDVKREIPNIDFIPMKNYEQMPNLYSAYKILIFPSRFESFGMVAVEAMACGVPVIMNKVGIAEKLMAEIPEFVLDNVDDLEEVERRIELIKDRYSEFSCRSRDFCKNHFSLEKFGQDWLRIIRDKVGN
ncbi:MAG: glycosyltransferase family 4 protein [Bacteriovorax sp.]